MENFFRLLIDELPSRLRDTFVLYYDAELSYQEISQKLNISYDNVRKRISQARKILQQRYNQEFLGEDNSKSAVISPCKVRNKSHKIEKIEIVNNEDLELSNQENLPVQVNIIVDEQSHRECEEIVKKSDINEDYLPLENILTCGKIVKNRLSNLVGWFNFQVIRNIHYAKIHVVVFHLFYDQVFWKLSADSGR